MDFGGLAEWEEKFLLDEKAQETPDPRRFTNGFMFCKICAVCDPQKLYIYIYIDYICILCIPWTTKIKLFWRKSFFVVHNMCVCCGITFVIFFLVCGHNTQKRTHTCSLSLSLVVLYSLLFVECGDSSVFFFFLFRRPFKKLLTSVVVFGWLVDVG